MKKIVGTFTKAVREGGPRLFAIAAVVLSLGLFGLSIRLNDLGMTQARASQRATVTAAQLQKEPRTVKVVIYPGALRAKLGSRADCVSAFRVESNYSLGAATLPPEGGEIEFTLLPGLPYSGITRIRADHDFAIPSANGSHGTTIAIARFNVAKVSGDRLVLSEFEIKEDQLSTCSK